MSGAAAVALWVYAAAVVAVSIQLGMTYAGLIRPRRLPLLLVLACCWVLFLAAERPSGGSWLLHAGVLAVPGAARSGPL